MIKSNSQMKNTEEGDVVMGITNGKGDTKRIMNRREVVKSNNGKPLLQIFSFFLFLQAKRQRQGCFI